MVLKPAIECLASGIIMIHNHPSNTISPSDSDREIVKRLKKACEVMDISLLDSMIVGGEMQSYFSFADEGLLF